MEDKIYLTEQYLNELKEEYNELINVTSVEVANELKAARALGDLSENADLDAAIERQAKVNARIKELENYIRNAEIISESKSTKYVRFGSTVEIEELDTKVKSTYMIVSSVEADPLNGKISNVTPLAEAILDQKVGSIVTVKADEQYDVKILKVN